MWTHHTGGKTFPIFEESRVKFQKFAYKGWREFLEREGDLLLKGGVLIPWCAFFQPYFGCIYILMILKKAVKFHFFKKCLPQKMH